MTLFDSDVMKSGKTDNSENTKNSRSKRLCSP